MRDRIRDVFLQARRLVTRRPPTGMPMPWSAARETAARIRQGGRVYIFGNGGSAADAIHWSGELMGRFSLDRPGIPAFALAVNPSVITAVANDYEFDQVSPGSSTRWPGRPTWSWPSAPAAGRPTCSTRFAACAAGAATGSIHRRGRPGMAVPRGRPVFRALAVHPADPGDGTPCWAIWSASWSRPTPARAGDGPRQSVLRRPPCAAWPAAWPELSP